MIHRTTLELTFTLTAKAHVQLVARVTGAEESSPGRSGRRWPRAGTGCASATRLAPPPTLRVTAYRASNTQLSQANCEPTNHLDLDALEWLEEHLRRRHGSLVVASHDRAFLDGTVSRVWELRDRRLTVFRGDYSQYRRQRDERDVRLGKDVDTQAEAIAREKELVQRYRSHRSSPRCTSTRPASNGSKPAGSRRRRRPGG